MEKQYLTEDKVNKMLTDIITQMELVSFRYDRVIGIRDGGIHISKRIAEALMLPHEAVKISFYQGENMRKTPVVDLEDFEPSKKMFLLVDDLIDTGSTLHFFKEATGMEQYIDFDFATLHWNRMNRFGQKPNFFAEEKKWKWIVYPWEIEKASSDV